MPLPLGDWFTGELLERVAKSLTGASMLEKLMKKDYDSATDPVCCCSRSALGAFVLAPSCPLHGRKARGLDPEAFGVSPGAPVGGEAKIAAIAPVGDTVRVRIRAIVVRDDFGRYERLVDNDADFDVEEAYAVSAAALANCRGEAEIVGLAQEMTRSRSQYARPSGQVAVAGVETVKFRLAEAVKAVGDQLDAKIMAVSAPADDDVKLESAIASLADVSKRTGLSMAELARAMRELATEERARTAVRGRRAAVTAAAAADRSRIYIGPPLAAWIDPGDVGAAVEPTDADPPPAPSFRRPRRVIAIEEEEAKR